MKNQTMNCVICGKLSGSFMGGHVHTENREVMIATFCSRECMDKDHKDLGMLDCKGCYGEWKEWMGIDPQGFQLGYIDRMGFHVMHSNKG